MKDYKIRKTFRDEIARIMEIIRETAGPDDRRG